MRNESHSELQRRDLQAVSWRTYVRQEASGDFMNEKRELRELQVRVQDCKNQLLLPILIYYGLQVLVCNFSNTVLSGHFHTRAGVSNNTGTASTVILSIRGQLNSYNIYKCFFKTTWLESWLRCFYCNTSAADRVADNLLILCCLCDKKKKLN